MAHYKSRKWRTEWQQHKKAAGLSDKLFKKGLGKDMDAADAAYKAFMTAKDDKARAAASKKHGQLRVKIRPIFNAYEQLVKQHGAGVEPTRKAVAFLNTAEQEICDNARIDIHGA